MKIEHILAEKIQLALKELYSVEVPSHEVLLQKTRKEFEGDLTLVVFPYLKASKKSPDQTAKEIGEYLKINTKEISDFNVIKGFLNLSLRRRAILERELACGWAGNLSKSEAARSM